MKLFAPYKLGNLELSNRIVMAPMTRSRAINNIPNQLMAEYYKQRSTAGLIISEGIAPSANGLGYPRIPGLYSEAQIEGWKLTTNAVHENGGKIFAQLMHTGRASHPDNMEENTEVLAPSAVGLSGEMWTDQNGLQKYPVPKAMTLADIKQAIEEYKNAAVNAIKAGFDGVEIHGANGYLVDQFINTASNKRDDEYGGSMENRARFAIEVAKAVSEAIGPEKTGIRFSPYGVFNDQEVFEGIEETFEYLAAGMNKLELLYVHIVDHSAMGAPEVPLSVKTKIKNAFKGIVIASGGRNVQKGEEAIVSGEGELVAFGRSFLSNPDLVYRLKNNLELNSPDMETFYTPGDKGYTDYPYAN
ncbi:alkene reductase [uncultured Draconibacterium sp.]|uniref:alkene reductase n=1 Tax=uncultured Draconibacterium sp. TaxID=1573823 RepID=UPI003216E94C